MEFMEDYDFELHYHPRKANVVADALSRKSISAMASLTMREWKIMRDIVEAQKGDPEVETIWESISKGKEEKGLNVYTNGSVHYFDQLFVLEPIRDEVLRESHHSHPAVHPYEPDPFQVLDWMDIEVDKDAFYEERPIQVLDSREQVMRGKAIPLVKVLWRYHGVEEAT
ncbi:uncharacterized protein LOC114303367 [Camellia sinensis]|uniref:uncharacterized protein LOC114303367 n=1 Tax=Camellia sinensis TaxID=4442 RepID=UPI001036A372|nr:uncharacterized protein LOC114303367 [Camellia sinensis]